MTYSIQPIPSSQEPERRGNDRRQGDRRSKGQASQKLAIESSSLLAKKRHQPKTRLFMHIFVVTLFLVVLNQVYLSIYERQEQAFSRQVLELDRLAQDMSVQAAAALRGDADAFVALAGARDSFAAGWQVLNEGSPSSVSTGIGMRADLPGQEALIAEQFPGFRFTWERTASDIDLVLENEALVREATRKSATMLTLIPLLQRSYEEAVAGLSANTVPLTTLVAAERQSWLMERIGVNLEALVAGRGTQTQAEQFSRDIAMFAANHLALLDGSRSAGIARITDTAARNSLNDVTAMLAGVREPARDIIAALDEINITAAAVERIGNAGDTLRRDIAAIGRLASAVPGMRLASPIVGYGLLLMLLLTIMVYGKQVIRQSQVAEQVSAEKNSRNNQAVLKLLGEISSLADGDLTVKATVGEDFTGSIADSINYAVDQLRELVSAITSVTLEVTSSTEKSRATVSSLSSAMRRQTGSINSVHQSIREIGDGISQVNENAQKTLDVARNSVKTAQGGASVVKDTIRGMDNIRDQIQDTSKRIKRLGESSQEIGGFVSLINDIAEHTNTLSLNAAIQAAMAGEAGKGFAVVADEVHALAERSADATRQIESLVKVIQGDIKEAVQSMEETTAEVVAGTRLAQGAGKALDDIQRVSKELEELVDSINGASSNQSKAASEITRSMDVIQQMASNTSKGVEATTEFMTSLGALTERLQNAVAGFSLEEKQKDKWSRFTAPPEAAVNDKPRGAEIKSLQLQDKALDRHDDREGSGDDEDGTSLVMASPRVLSA